MGFELEHPPWRRDEVDSYFRGQQAERSRIGQELHDSTGQLLVALQLNLLQMHRPMAGEKLSGLVGEMAETVDALNREIRSISFLHCTRANGEENLAQAIESLVAGFARRTGLVTSLTIDGPVSDVPPAVRQEVYRIAQEALTNVHRHARARQVSMRLMLEPGLLSLIVDDDGIGIARKSIPGFYQGIGLWSMRSRAQSLGGRFSVRRLRQGTRVRITVPSPAPRPARRGPAAECRISPCSPPSRALLQMASQVLAEEPAGPKSEVLST